MPNLSELSEYKQKLLTLFMNDSRIVSVLRDEKAEFFPAVDLRYKQIYPWKHVVETTEEARTFITFNITVPDCPTIAVTDFNLIIWVFTHDSLMPFDKAAAERSGVDMRGTRDDVLCQLIDEALNGRTDYGFGKLSLKKSDFFDAGKNYAGRYMIYHVKDYNRICGRL